EEEGRHVERRSFSEWSSRLFTVRPFHAKPSARGGVKSSITGLVTNYLWKHGESIDAEWKQTWSQGYAPGQEGQSYSGAGSTSDRPLAKAGSVRDGESVANIGESCPSGEEGGAQAGDGRVARCHQGGSNRGQGPGRGHFQ